MPKRDLGWAQVSLVVSARLSVVSAGLSAAGREI